VIIVSAASPGVPEPLAEQLAVGGRMIIPIGDRETQVLMLYEKDGQGVMSDGRQVNDVRFVPLLGQFGFQPSPENHAL
jgi:protein-L-isoaspartate(D-aspartate) O-methyltransferase